VLLTLDLGTSTTKATLWDADGPRATGRAPVETVFPAPDRAEQDPGRWWPSVREACAAARVGAEAQAGTAGTGTQTGTGAGAGTADDLFGAVEVIGCVGARQTFVPVTAAGLPLGPALVWSDRRAAAEAAELAGRLGGTGAVRGRTGAILDGGAVAAKLAWLAAHQAERLAASRWLLTPRDLVVFQMTGQVVTDRTMVSAAGLTDAAGALVAELLAAAGDRLPPVLDPESVVGPLSATAAAELGLPPGVPVVLGAGDRACEVLGTAAGAGRPMVSWGTTANVSVPVDLFPDPVPEGLTVSRAAGDGWLLEGGLSAAGSLLGWLAGLTGLDPGTLMARAADRPAGADGVLCLPWLGGARAPWWRERARGGFVGVSFGHDAGHLARAVLEAVAWEVQRCLAAAAPATSLVLTGADATTAPWAEVLTAVTGLPAARRRSGQAASAGAAILAGRAVGRELELDRLDPVVETLVPDPVAVARYAELREAADAAADAVLALGESP
jgi:xylulokinase